MEKQIIMVKTMLEALRQPLPNKPILVNSEEGELQIHVSSLLNANTTTQSAESLVNIIYTTIKIALHQGMGDRFIMLFNEVHSSNMSVIDGHKYKPPKSDLILNRDFSIYNKHKDLEETFKEIEKEENLIFSNKIDEHIKSKLNPDDLEKFNQMKTLQKYFENIIDIDISLDTNKIGRTAFIEVYKDVEVINELNYF
jgi:hypothetical protein